MSVNSALLLLVLLSLGIGSAFANPPLASPYFDTVSIYRGRGVDHDLKEIPGAVLSGNIAWENTSFTGVGFDKTLKPLGYYFKNLQSTLLDDIYTGYELVLIQHRGLQNNSEIGAAYSLKSPDAMLGSMSVNFRAGSGLSYALGTPSYEDGTTSDPDKHYRLQLLLFLELEWKVPGLSKLSFITRVHHRSGVFGLIAPRQVGSNFLVAGLRYNY